LEIVGASVEETKTIEDYNYNKVHVDIKSILNETETLQQKILKAGYIESEYDLAKKINDSSFQIKFHLKNKYESIEINYNDSEIEQSILEGIIEKENEGAFTISVSRIEQVLELINLKIANNGFPFTKIKLSEILIKNKQTLTARLEIIKENKKRSLDKIVIKGYTKFPKSYLKRYLKIKPQKSFNIEAIKKKLTVLNNLRFAEQTKNPEVLFTKDSTNLFIYLKKSESNTFDGFLGFSTNEETNKIDLNGYLNLELINNFNYGESLRLVYKSDESEQKNFEVNLNLPYLFSTPLGTELSLKILKRDSTFTTVNQKASVFYQLNSKNRVFIGVDGSESNYLLAEDLNTSVTDYKSNLYTFKYTFENLNNQNTLFQLKSNINVEYGFGSRKTKTNDENQNIITIDAFNIFNLNNKNSFYTRFQGAVLQSNSYLDNELFRFGGINSIRGFQENSIIANQYLVVNTEYRHQLSSNIYVHSIIDFSNFENKLANIKENLYGFGLGFGIATKAGLLKFNFANGKTEMQNFKFSNSKIHISLVSIF
jgi:hypothetical protein